MKTLSVMSLRAEALLHDIILLKDSKDCADCLQISNLACWCELVLVCVGDVTHMQNTLC